MSNRRPNPPPPTPINKSQQPPRDEGGEMRPVPGKQAEQLHHANLRVTNALARIGDLKLQIDADAAALESKRRDLDAAGDTAKKVIEDRQAQMKATAMMLGVDIDADWTYLFDKGVFVRGKVPGVGATPIVAREPAQPQPAPPTVVGEAPEETH